MNEIERVQLAIRESGKKPTEIAKHCGVSRAAVSQWIGGQTKALTAEKCFLLAEVTGFSARWLALGKGPRRTDAPSDALTETSALGALTTEEMHQLGDRLHAADLERIPEENARFDRWAAQLHDDLTELRQETLRAFKRLERKIDRQAPPVTH